MMLPTIVLWQVIKIKIGMFGLRRRIVWLISSFSSIQHQNADLLSMVGEQRTGKASEGELILKNKNPLLIKLQL